VQLAAGQPSEIYRQLVIVDRWGADPQARAPGSTLEVVAIRTTTSEPTADVLVPVADPLFTADEGQALAGFLSGYSGLTRDAYSLDLRQYTVWCAKRCPRLRYVPHRP
jgi:hypothetical protein